MEKTCTTCGVVRSVDDFNKSRTRRNGSVAYRASCKKCQRDYSKKHYLKSSSPARRYDGSFDMAYYGRQRLVAFRTWIDTLKQNPCTDCGRTFHPVAMDFDHVRGKKVKGIAGMWSWERSKVLQELAKCELVCSNCHRVRTYERKQHSVRVAS